MPPGNPVASPGEEAGPANQTLRVVPYPYQPDEVIGGDSIKTIKTRLLQNLRPKLRILSFGLFTSPGFHS